LNLNNSNLNIISDNVDNFSKDSIESFDKRNLVYDRKDDNNAKENKVFDLTGAYIHIYIYIYMNE
jgi:predicted secreted Zn-dependent protease